MDIKSFLKGLIFKSKVIKNFFIYAFGAFLLKGISVIIAPIVMRILTPADYGLLSLVTNFIAIVFTCVGLGLRQLLSVEYFHCDTIGRKRLINDIIAIYCLCMVPAFLLLFGGRNIINKFIFVKQASNHIITFCLLVACLKFFSELFYQVLQYTGRALKLTVVQVFAALILLSLNLYFLYFLNWGIFSIIAAQFASLLFVLVIAAFFYISDFYYAHLDISCSLSKSWWYVQRGLPFVPRVLFAWVLAVGDRWVLAKYATLADVGIYSVADMFGQLFQMVVILPFSYAYIPYMMEKFAKHKGCFLSIKSIDKCNLRNMVLTMIALVIVVSLGLIVFRPLVYIVLPPRYHMAFSYIWSLLIGYIFLLGTYFASIFLQFQKCIYFLIFALLVPAICNIMLNLLLVPHFAIWGCVIATVISYILYFLITVLYNFYLKRVK
ncbi:lipopolysaccharide biosynthesis protein [Candidatus Dependentiae bacterium]